MNERDFMAAFIKPWRLENPHNAFFKDAVKPAAVLICLFEHEGELHVLFTERASHLKHHAGQISFPGGKAEKSDKNLVETAFREAQEEIGLNPAHLRLLGQLDIYKTISGFSVLPILAIYEKPLLVPDDLIIDKNEVAQAFHVPLAFLMEKNHYFVENIIRKGNSLPVYFIPYEGKMIWGATAGMLAQLQLHIQNDTSS